VAIEILITIGLGFVIWRRKTQKMTTTLLLLSLASYAVLLVIMVLPSLGNAIIPYRAFSIALLFLAPCCVFGVAAIFNFASGRLHADKSTVSKLESAAMIGVLIPYFLFQGGFIFELTEHPSNYALLPSQNQNQRVEYFDNTSWSYAASSQVPIESVYASKWLSSFMGRSPVFGDIYRSPEVIGTGLISPDLVTVLGSLNVNQSAKNAYTYLGPANVQQGTVKIRTSQFDSQTLPISILPALTTGSRIYNNGLVEVYYHK
jgi:uncharacterized membrane protein